MKAQSILLSSLLSGLIAAGCWSMQDVVITEGPDSDSDMDTDSDADSDSDSDTDSDAPPSGSPLWARRIGGDWDDTVWSVATLPDGTVIAAGTMLGSGWADGPEGPELPIGSEDEIASAFVVAYDPDGDLLWARTVIESSHESSSTPLDIVLGVDSGGRIVLGVTIRGPALWMPDTEFQTSVSSGLGNPDEDTIGVLARLTTTGDPLTMWQLDSHEYFVFERIETGPDGRIHVLGRHNDEIWFDHEIYGFEIPAGGIDNGFIMPLTPDFEPSETYYAGNKTLKDIAFPSANEIMVVGGFTETAFFGAGDDQQLFVAQGEMDGFIANYDSGWNLDDVDVLSGSDLEVFRSAQTIGSGATLVTGVHTAEGEFGSVYLPDSPDGESSFLARFDPGGSLSWLRRFYPEGQGYVYATELAPLATSALVAGSFIGAIHFEDSSSDVTFTLDYAYAGFMVRYDSDGDIDWINNVASETGAWVNDLMTDNDHRPVLGGKFRGIAVFTHIGTESLLLEALTADEPPVDQSSDGFVAVFAP